MAKAVRRFPELEAPAVPGTAVTFKGFASSWRSAIGASLFFPCRDPEGGELVQVEVRVRAWHPSQLH